MDGCSYQYCTKPGQCMFKRTGKEALYSMFLVYVVILAIYYCIRETKNNNKVLLLRYQYFPVKI